LLVVSVANKQYSILISIHSCTVLLKCGCTEITVCCIRIICDGCYVQKFRQLYDKEKEGQGEASAEIQFAYAWCLVRSKETANLRLGTQLLEGNAFTKVL